MSAGFVYLLGNNSMPGIYKIGRTSRCVHMRARQLSASTSVPTSFIVICHIKAADAGLVESRLHSILADFRVSDDREFFRFAPIHLPWVLGLFEYHPDGYDFQTVSTWLIDDADVASEDPENPWERNNYEEPVMTRYRPVERWDIVYLD